VNFRDVGGSGEGLELPDGTHMAKGVVYRSAKLNGITAADKKKLKAAGVSEIFDLRTPAVIKGSPDPSVPGAKNTRVNIFAVNATPPFTAKSVADAQEHMRIMYENFVNNSKQRAKIAELLTKIAKADGAVIIHCAEGKDRTGWTSALLQTVAGAERGDIITEFLLSNKYRKDQIAAGYAKVEKRSGKKAADAKLELLRLDASYLEAGFQAATAKYGSIDKYLSKGLGLTKSILTKLQAKLRPLPGTQSVPAVSKKTAAALAGKVIVVDPGHNGKYRKSFNTKKVPAGNGKKKACNSSGTAANSGYPEHAYTWEQSKLLKRKLESLGAKVLLTRQNDNGLGPCVNKRAQVANDSKADLLISIHADGSYSKKARGFHIIISTAMAGGQKTEKRSRTLAKNARDSLKAATAMPVSTYIGKGTGLSPRSDIATLNLLKNTPGIMMEMGNMRHSSDAKLLSSAAFREKAAAALAQAALATLTSK
jgi:N-acetylmuramoyl-L-alanine amidase